MRRRAPILAALACAVGLLLGGCGGGSGAGRTGPVHTRTVDVYSSLPVEGPERAESKAIESGIALALSQAHHRAGEWAVHYVALDDSTVAANGWTVLQTEAAAREAATDPATVLDIGDLDSGSSAVSEPILSEAGIPQISPGSPAADLTTPPASDARSAPRTFLRLDASDAAEAEAELQALHAGGCDRVGIVAGPQAGDFPSLLAREARGAGLGVAFSSAPNAFPRGLRPRVAGCVALAAAVTAEPGSGQADDAEGVAAQMADIIHATLPHAMIMGAPALCNPRWTNGLLGGVQAAVDPYLRCTLPTLPVAAYSGEAAFTALYEIHDHGEAPSAAAVLGYTAMSLGLDAIRAAASDGDDRSAVRAHLLARRPRSTMLGPFAFDAVGNAVPTLVGLYDVDTSDAPHYLRALRSAPPGGVG